MSYILGSLAQPLPLRGLRTYVHTRARGGALASPARKIGAAAAGPYGENPAAQGGSREILRPLPSPSVVFDPISGCAGGASVRGAGLICNHNFSRPRRHARSSPYVSYGRLSAGAHERRRAAHVYVWPIMRDEISRAYVYVGQHSLEPTRRNPRYHTVRRVAPYSGGHVV
jgi:hypothetical protein